MHHEIRAYLASKRGAGGLADVADHDSLLECGLIDSASMVDLIVHLEKTYSISIGDDDMIPENFDSIEAIAAYVSQKRLGGAPPVSSS